MEDKIKDLIGESLREHCLIVDSVILEKVNNNLFLRICLDSEEIINIDKIILATKIIDPIINAANLIEKSYILDIYGKSKGSDNNEW